MQFRSLQITASVLFVYFFMKAYVVGTHLNCIDVNAIQMSTHNICLYVKKKKKITLSSSNKSISDLFYYVP